MRMASKHVWWRCRRRAGRAGGPGEVRRVNRADEVGERKVVVPVTVEEDSICSRLAHLHVQIDEIQLGERLDALLLRLRLGPRLDGGELEVLA